MTDRITIAISCGDLNGIGLETLIKVFSDKRMYQFVTPVLYANLNTFEQHLDTLPDYTVVYSSIRSIDEAKADRLNILQVWDESINVHFGEPDPELSRFTVKSLEKATDDVMAGLVDALVTLPINKDVMNKADFNAPGHTEYLKERAGVEESLMFLVSDDMKVGLVTNHLPISEVAQNIRQSTILRKVNLMNRSLIHDFGIEKPKIAILGLNPHAGDNGLIGTEELKIIIPAIEKLTQEQIIALGPYSADGFFGKAEYAKFDGIMAMYHDQGLMPFKMTSFGRGVNFTAGLPFVRTSPDHGTAYSIAGQDLADAGSLRNAIFMAHEIVQNRNLFE